MKFLDCTLRDGGYYNAWDFSIELIEDYLQAMQAISADYVELGFRSLKIDGFKGGCAYTTDSFIKSLNVPAELKLGVMINASELVQYEQGVTALLERLFRAASASPVTLVRIACHVHEFEKALPACLWLKEQGYEVGFNLMQVADRSLQEIRDLAVLAARYPLDVLYFADSMGSMNPQKTQAVVDAFRTAWTGDLGIHTHDNMGLALANSVAAVQSGVAWVDGTLTGMGRGPGNVKTEYLVLELESSRKANCNITTLLKVIRKHFKPLQAHYGWGSNPYYYLAGKYSIHPSYIQEMLADSRYSDEDILAVIEHLKIENSKQFNLQTLNTARHFYNTEPKGSWQPQSLIQQRDVLILGTGQGAKAHGLALENFIQQKKPFVIALNTQKAVDDKLIDIRAACHPVRLLADCEEHARLPHPLATPVSMLPEDVITALGDKPLLDFGLTVRTDTFEFHEHYAILPNSLVIAYALAIATSGKARCIYLAGFDGYGEDDPRNHEMNRLFKCYMDQPKSIAIASITPTRYQIPESSVYALI
ncbi:MAG: aldolase catalytic domain-containing protein [Methylovulum sp.]|uniref:aldolase catalytic domain-containing protein n=1 Tax=Methylovulum sp. TaxID=1916980 RepID=UPI0026074549|nr:aldolase catalytic domain-containing protein [Methylovulum sp.]MDD2725034.1 aldolase catalytic domain-containing protein [Methylovulum sp.]MDD5124245.1 aldolase catalytic domain-containing protein [Methylovulum sp.]